MTDATLLDRFAPHPDFVEHHEIEVRGTRDAAYRALWTTDFGTSGVVQLLLRLRSLPSTLLGRGARRSPGRATLETILENGFGRLAEVPGHEVVLGVLGRFWRPVGNVAPFRAEQFTGPLPPGLAKAVWNLAVRQDDPARRVVVSTETRVVCADVASRWKFAAYWTLIRPFSGLIRITMLRAIQRTCDEHA